MTEAEIKRIATEAADEAVRKLLLTLGVATGNEDAVLALQADFKHLRESRLAVAAIRMKAWMVITGTLVSGILAALWMALSSKGH